MPQDIVRITVLLASTSEVNRERAAVRLAVEEINRTSGEREGWVLTVKGWETHTRPAEGRAQAVINTQIGPTDIFLGILWTRIGTSTGKAISGTVEEYDEVRKRRARSRAHVKPSVLFYFKTQARKPADIDPDQWKAVIDFKARVFKNSLAREFETTREFEGLIRAHLTAEAHEIAGAHRTAANRTTSTSRSVATGPKSKPSPRKTAPITRARAEPTKSEAKPKRKRRTSKPKLDVPTIVTDRDRAAYVERAARSVRTHFEKAARVFNRAHANARIVCSRPDGAGGASLVAEAFKDGASIVRIRVRAETDARYGSRPALVYEKGYAGYGSDTFHIEQRVHLVGGSESPSFENPDIFNWSAASVQPLDVARTFWKRLTDALR